MKRISVAGWTAAMALALGTGVMGAQATQWKIDPMHSEADFAIKHMAISTVHGSFHGVSGTITFDPANVAKSSVEATIPVDTVDTGVAPRDTDLKSPRFFDATKFPTMTFKSTSVHKAGDHYDVAGDLTLHGVTKPVVLKLEEPGKEEIGMDKKSVHRGFTATTTINRQDFGLAFNGTLSSGDAVLSDEVKIEIDIDAAKI
ncbi:YceI family protein [Granulicella sp. L46]|uniref:YceI family protein n=1 Tax=Granulicella sp. L46 TaxID=1641865 RepID=UPI00131E6069|nr:YceI family protein [Granulicella sp. L46]